MSNRNCLSYWLPRLLEAGLPVPRTEIVRVPDGVSLLDLLDGQTPSGFGVFLVELRAAVERIGTPCFLRTGQGSGKPQWERTCFLKSVEDIPQHVFALVEWSEMVDFIGLPVNVWCVRELLPVKPVAVLPYYGNMPLVPEQRYFVRDGKVLCCHPYWPEGAIADGFRDEPPNLPEIVAAAQDFSCEEYVEAASLARRVAEVFNGDGGWSVDLLLDAQRRWHVTDMAEMERSYHWPGCPNGGVGDANQDEETAEDLSWLVQP